MKKLIFSLFLACLTACNNPSENSYKEILESPSVSIPANSPSPQELEQTILSYRRKGLTDLGIRLTEPELSCLHSLNCDEPYTLMITENQTTYNLKYSPSTGFTYMVKSPQQELTYYDKDCDGISELRFNYYPPADRFISTHITTFPIIPPDYPSKDQASPLEDFSAQQEYNFGLRKFLQLNKDKCNYG